jgi:hypothetical protein
MFIFLRVDAPIFLAKYLRLGAMWFQQNKIHRPAKAMDLGASVGSCTVTAARNNCNPPESYKPRKF